MLDKALSQLNTEKGVMDFLREPTIKIAEVVTGILVSDQKDWKLSAGKLVQAVIQGKFLTQLGREIEKYKDEGKIKENYFATNKNQASLYELLKFIDDAPDEEQFRAAKSIFFKSISAEAGEQDEALAYEFLQTVKRLSGTEILILKSNFSLAQAIASVPGNSHEAWVSTVAGAMGYKDYTAIVEKYEDNLMSLKLISQRTASDFSGIRQTNHYRLTDAGYKFCEFIQEYE